MASTICGTLHSIGFLARRRLLLFKAAALLSPTVSLGQQAITISPPHVVLRPAGVWVIRDGSAFDGAAIAANGDVVLARGDPTVIEVFDRRGRRRYKLPEPTDDLRPVPIASVAVLDGGKLAITDQRQAVIGLYDISGATPRFLSTVAGPPAISGICALGGSLVLYSPDSAGRVEMLRSGQRVFSTIVRAVGMPRPRVQQALNESQLVCLPDRNQVLVVGIVIPTVALFAVNGDLAWRADLADIARMRVETSDPQSVTYRALPAGYQKVLRVTRLSSRTVAVQLVTVGRESFRWGDPGPIETRFLDLTTGREISRSTNVPEILAAQDGELLVADHARRLVTRHRFTLNLGQSARPE